MAYLGFRFFFFFWAVRREGELAESCKTILNSYISNALVVISLKEFYIVIYNAQMHNVISVRNLLTRV